MTQLESEAERDIRLDASLVDWQSVNRALLDQLCALEDENAGLKKGTTRWVSASWRWRRV